MRFQYPDKIASTMESRSASYANSAEKQNDKRSVSFWEAANKGSAELRAFILGSRVTFEQIPVPEPTPVQKFIEFCKYAAIFLD